MKIKLVCPHGFSYISYQRVVCCEQNPINYEFEESPELATKIANHFNLPEYAIDGADDGMVYVSGASLFLISGESASLSDVADAVATEFKVDVIFKDGDEPEEIAEC